MFGGWDVKRSRATQIQEQTAPVEHPDVSVLDETGESPTVEVRVWQHGELIHRELCESVDIAAGIVQGWSELDDVTCEVKDLSVAQDNEGDFGS